VTLQHKSARVVFSREDVEFAQEIQLCQQILKTY
jgi:hypothetical protein